MIECRCRWPLVFAVGLSLACPRPRAGEDAKPAVDVSFARGAWDAGDFILVKSARWPNKGGWVQHDDHIANTVPADASEDDLLARRIGETYTAMIYKEPLAGDNVIRAKMSFDHRMAPSIVIAEAPGAAEDGYPEFRTHYEVVLYDEGVNVWRHVVEDGRQSWRRVAFLTARYEPGVAYDMAVRIRFTGRGPQWDIQCGPHRFGFIDDLLPRAYYAGVIGCEGVNRFYSFSLSQ